MKSYLEFIPPSDPLLDSFMCYVCPNQDSMPIQQLEFLYIFYLVITISVPAKTLHLVSLPFQYTQCLLGAGLSHWLYRCAFYGRN